MKRLLERRAIPLWYMLSPEARGKLATYQYKHFGVRLAIPSFPFAEIEVHTRRGFRAIDRFMRETPNQSISVQGRK